MCNSVIVPTGTGYFTFCVWKCALYEELKYRFAECPITSIIIGLKHQVPLGKLLSFALTFPVFFVFSISHQ